MTDHGLEAAVGEEFLFLVDEFGFRCVESRPHLVRYESERAIVEVVFDGSRSYEVRVQFGMRDATGPHFSLDELLRSRGAAGSSSVALQATTRQELEGAVRELSGALRKHGGELLVGDPVAFAALTAHRRREVDQFATERALTEARTLAKVAWEKREFVAVVAALEPHRENLSDAERARLDLAKKYRASGETD